MHKKLDFAEVDEKYVEEYEELEKDYHVYSAAAKSLVRFVNPKDTDVVVDIGCGTGISSLAAYEKVKKGKLFGIDISPNMIAMCKKKFTGKMNVNFIIGDGFYPEVRIKGKVDVVLSNFAYYYFLTNLDVFFKNIGKVLNSKGKFVFNITSYYTPFSLEGKKYNDFGNIYFEEADKVLKEHRYEGRGGFAFDKKAVSFENAVEVLKKSGFSKVKTKVFPLPITPTQALDFTYKGFYKYGAAFGFSKTLSEMEQDERLKLVEEIIKRTKKKLEDIREKPTIIEVLAIKP